MLVLGPLLVVSVFTGIQFAHGRPWAGVAGALAGVMLSGLLLESLGLYFHARDLRRGTGEGQASQHEQCTTFGKTYMLRNAGLGLSMILLGGLAVLHPDGVPGLLLWGGAALIILVTAVIGRALFYALVIPTTLPGAFFWRNRGFEQHARDSGLAGMPQVGVLPGLH
jgi:hypothetical protein